MALFLERVRYYHFALHVTELTRRPLRSTVRSETPPRDPDLWDPGPCILLYERSNQSVDWEEGWKPLCGDSRFFPDFRNRLLNLQSHVSAVSCPSVLHGSRLLRPAAVRPVHGFAAPILVTDIDARVDCHGTARGRHFKHGFCCSLSDCLLHWVSEDASDFLKWC